jgi:hypothetical protein
MGVRTRICFLLALLFAPIITSAHAFGQQYTLPLPFSLYAMGATLALVGSFIFLGLYSDPVRADSPYVIRRYTSRMGVFSFIGGLLSVSILIGTLILVLFGSNDFFTNPAPILFWIALMLGVTYVSAIVGGMWRFINPFEHIVRFFLRLHVPLRPYPKGFAYVPALIFYYILIWFELLSYGLGASPWVIGAMLIMYLVISFIGAYVYGVEDWFQFGDMFNAFFGVIGYFAPIQIYPSTGSGQAGGGVDVMPPGERLIERSVANLWLLLFILFMLSSTAFDSLQETQIWWTIMYHFPIQVDLYSFERALALAASPLVFFAFYGAAILLMKTAVRTAKSFTTLALRFGYSLIPIAVAYNFAHYFMILVNESQTLYAQISDPFATGMNLFGTADYQVNIAFISAQAVWYTQISTIVIGHIIATYVAHRIALREFDSRSKVIVGQLPILLLMVLYTVFGLWILSQGYQT